LGENWQFPGSFAPRSLVNFGAMTDRTDTLGITPDDKDWTWVLARPCPECGLDVRTVDRGAVADRLRDTAARWLPVLRRAAVSRRPDPATWSPLEYGCHVRDTFLRFDQRLQLMLTEHDPLFDNWDQDRTAVEGRYGEQDPATVATDLLAAGEQVAGRFAGVRGAEWERPGRRGGGSSFTVESLGRYLLHDPIHHLYDVAR